ncbi:MAG TPA: DUF523 domain-containing protein [Epulopiscium sp.]|nr:DUF523 domain-containing protein [Candidatus Epulonipiscium sp.]
MNILVSACMLGVSCRYDGTGMLQEVLKNKMGRYNFIPICPEQLGGMETPRQASERVGAKIISKVGEDVTHNFARGASETLKIAKLYGCDYAILKERSPSCGYGEIYDGTFSGGLTTGNGVTAELLENHKITVIGESKIEEMFRKFEGDLLK